MSQLKTSLDHLPELYRRELDRAVKILFEEFEKVTALKTSEKKLNGKILKIILYGSFARGTWVDDKKSGYKSDYDLLIIVNSEYMTDFVEYWYEAEERFIRETMLGRIKRAVHFIVHSLADVNGKLAEGQYFFTDIKNDGIALFERKDGTKLGKAKNLTSQQHYEISQEYFDHWFPKAQDAFEIAGLAAERGKTNDAAFMLHQAVERAYHCVLLTFTHYTPGTHDIKELRSLAEEHDERLIAAWPREKGLPLVTKHRAAFELLKKAYVEARYSKHFTVTDEQLTWLSERAAILNDLVKEACTDHLATLKAEL